MEKRIIIIDGNSLINRAYYAMQRPMITKEGLYTQGVYGFLNILNKIHTEYEPEYLTVTFDRKAPTFRHIEYKEYKAGRKKMPVELAMQMPLLKEVLAAMNIKMFELDGFEADDIIGTIAREAEEKGLLPLIITGDKDELQLATDKTKVLITKKGISEFELYDREAMIEKYGFTPEQFIDYKGLMGDQSDNIPGIPGVGEKTAQKLILQYGSVANLIEKVETITNAKLKEKVETYAMQALMSRRLATINTHVPIEIAFDEFKVEEPNYTALIEIYSKLEFNSFLKRLKIPDDSTKLESASKESLFSDENEDVIFIRDTSGFQGFQKELDSLESTESLPLKVFSDHNHKDIPVVNGISIMLRNKCYYIQTQGTNLFEIARETLISKEFAFVGHNLILDYYSLFAGYGDKNQIKVKTSFDTAIAQYLLEPTRSNYLLKTIVMENFHEEFPSETEAFGEGKQLELFGESTEDNSPDYASYGAKWCQAVSSLIPLLTEKLKNEGLEEVFHQVELPLIEVMASMEALGFAIDREELTNAGDEIKNSLRLLTNKIYELAGQEFNINSPSQLGEILFEKLGLPVGKKTKTGYSTNAEVLEKLRDKHEIIDFVLEYRTLSKLNSTYIEGLLPLIHTDGKIHAHFQQTVTATGRLSCTEPNLQNIPIRQELGRKLRKAFVSANQDCILVGADYSQIELRILAHMSQDALLIDAFNQGDDIHKITASKVFNVPEDDVTPLLRSNAKAVNFGVIYGMSGFGLSTELNITRKEAERYIDEYFKKYTKVKEFMDKMVEDCKNNGYVTTIMGRKRTIHEINAGNYMVRQLGERLAMNSPIQGSAADIIKLAMIKVYKEIKTRNLKSKLVLQVHDELIIETYREELEVIKKLLKDNMEHAVKLQVNLTADVNVGENWYDLK